MKIRPFGLPPNPSSERGIWSPIDEAERLITKSRAVVVHGGSYAFYQPNADRIHLPEKNQFPEGDSYYATALHELVHWTGHPARLNRELSRRFGEASYAIEELVAEMGSAFLCAHCGINGKEQHASYLQSWLSVLKSDKRAIFTAAVQAPEYLSRLNCPSAPPLPYGEMSW
ncbi:MAG: DNA primase TraC [Nitrospira sp.]|nr:DNA primase TraC [Nitrospira sp.]